MAVFARNRPRQGPNPQYYRLRASIIANACVNAGFGMVKRRTVYANGRADDDLQQTVVPANPPARITPAGEEEYVFDVAPEMVKRMLDSDVLIAAALNEQQIRLYREGSRVIVRVLGPQSDRQEIVSYEDVLTLDARLKPGELLLGYYHRDDAMRQLVVDVASANTVHLLVAGATGSGKTNLMQAMALSAQASGTPVALFDPPGRFEPFSAHPTVWRSGVFREPDECLAGLAALARRIDRRESGLLVVFIDELSDLVSQAPETRAHITRIATSGRQFGLHLVVGTQYANVGALGRELLGNLKTRIVGHVPDAMAAYVLTGRPQTGADKLPPCGSFVLVRGGYQREFRAPLVTEALLASVARQWPPVTADGTRRLRVPPTPPLGRDAKLCQTERAKGGRPRDEIPGEIVAEIQAYHAEYGEWPSLAWINELARARTGGEWNYGKRRRALETAQEVQP